MLSNHTKLVAVVTALILLAPAYSDAKSSRSSSSSYSRPGYSKPPTSLPGSNRPATVNTGGSQNRAVLPREQTRTYSKPIGTNDSYNRLPTQPSPSTTYSRPSKEKSAAKTMQPAAIGAIGNAANATMSRDSFNKYLEERNRNSRPLTEFNKENVRSNPVVRSTRTQYPRIDDYVQQRSRDLEAYRNRYPESQKYTRNMPPNYGIFDSNFLLGIVLGHTFSSSSSSSANAAWLNGQKDQEWYKQLRSDLNTAAQEDAVLKARLDKLDIELEEAKHKNLEHPTSLPIGVPAAVAIAPEAIILDAYETHSFPWGWTLFMSLIGLLGIVAFYFYQVGNAANNRR